MSTSTSTSTSTEEGSSDGADQEACLPTVVFDALDQHVHDLEASAALLAGHPSETEAVGFLHAPALPSPPAIAAVFAGPLVMVCTDPLLYDPFCEENRCSQIECTGVGAGWIMYFWLEHALAVDGWAFDDVRVNVRWNEGNPGATFAISSISRAPGWFETSMTGMGMLGPDRFDVIESYLALHEAGVTVLEYGDDPEGYSGQLTIGTVVVAEVDAAGHLRPTGDCPE